jgi:hypothetical protein
MAGVHIRIPGAWPEPNWEQQLPSEPRLPRFRNYRVSNIDATFDRFSLETSLKSALHLNEDEEIRVWSLAPCLIYPEKKIATISVKGNTGLLKAGGSVRLVYPDERVSHSEQEPMVIDIDFLGFTPLNSLDGVDHSFE